MNTNEVFESNKKLLEDLFPPQISSSEYERLLINLSEIEKLWDSNIKDRIGNNQIKYLLICEAPPQSGKYFYKSTKEPLFIQVWKTFFGNQKICSVENDAYQCLADIGFLLIDTLPYSKNYGNHRFNPQYYRLIDSCLPWWLNKLNGLNLHNDLKIGFGFNQNAMNIMIALSRYKPTHPLQTYMPFTPEMVAQDRAGQPTKRMLEQKQIFDTKYLKHQCVPCI